MYLSFIFSYYGPYFLKGKLFVDKYHNILFFMLIWTSLFVFILFIFVYFMKNLGLNFLLG